MTPEERAAAIERAEEFLTGTPSETSWWVAEGFARDVLALEELPPAVELGKTFLHLSFWRGDTLLYQHALPSDVEGFQYDTQDGMVVTTVKIERIERTSP